jgi:hypothetical protein
MIFAFNTSYPRSIKTTPFEVVFGPKPRTAQKPNPDLRRQYGKEIGTEMFQRFISIQKSNPSS